MPRRLAIFALAGILVSSVLAQPLWALTAPRLNNSPSWDVVVTNPRPLLTFGNAAGGLNPRTYTIQLDRKESFDSPDLISYGRLPETTPWITSKRLAAADALKDNSQYFWRVRAVDAAGDKGPWAQSRFFVDTRSDDAFMNLTRAPVRRVEVSSGQNPKNITDLDDPGQDTYWRASPPGPEVQWVSLDLGQTRTISRIWMLSNPRGPTGWLKDFVWQMSDDEKNWRDIAGARVKGNDTFRNIIDFKPVAARYFRLRITAWQGYSPWLNELVLYSPSRPSTPQAPLGDYVLLVGNQRNGFTFSQLAAFIADLDLGLKTLSLPHYEVSLAMYESLAHKPRAIILSGNNASYQNLPMFEYNGEFELIRACPAPILGICCGHQMTVMAYGYTFVRGMGWADISSLRDFKSQTRIRIKKNDPLLAGLPDPFIAPEIHGCAVAELPRDYEVLAASTYVQVIKSQTKMLYGVQFHPEIASAHNQARALIRHFLDLALAQTR